MKQLNCRDAGFDCEGVVRGETTEDVMTQAGAHVKEVHGMDVTPEMAQSISTKIHDA